MMDLESGKNFYLTDTKDLEFGKIFFYSVQNVQNAEIFVLYDLRIFDKMHTISF